MKYLKKLITGELRKISKEKEAAGAIKKLNDISKKIEGIDEKKISQANAMTLREIASELEKLSVRAHMLRSERLGVLSKVLHEKAKEMETAKKVKDVVTEIVDESIDLISAKKGTSAFNQGTASKLDSLIREEVTKSARSAGMGTAEKIIESASKIAKHEDKPMNETHINLGVELIGKRLKKNK